MSRTSNWFIWMQCFMKAHGTCPVRDMMRLSSAHQFFRRVRVFLLVIYGGNNDFISINLPFWRTHSNPLQFFAAISMRCSTIRASSD